MIKEVELGSVCHFENGDRGKNYPSQSAFIDQGIPFISAKNLEDYVIKNENLKFISEETYNKLGSGKLRPNDILFCLRGSLGKFAINKNSIKGAIASSLVLLRVKEELNINYLKHYLKSPRIKRLVTKSDNGSSQPNLSATNVKKFQIPLPPLDQQKQIAKILDTADAYRQKTKALIKKYEALTQSLFLDMFGDPVTNPKGWEKVSLESCLHKVHKIGKDFSEDSIEYVDIASVDNIRNNITETTTYKTNERPSRAQQILLSDDVIFSTVRPNLKNIAINHVDGRIGSTGFFVCRVDREKLSNLFLYKVLLSDSVTDYFVGITSGANYPAIKSSDMRKFQVITPPLENQNQFAERVQAIEAQKALAQQELDKADQLFNSLLQKAFKGELV